MVGCLVWYEDCAYLPDFWCFLMLNLKRLRVQIQYCILSRYKPIFKGILLSCFLGSFHHGNKELSFAQALYFFLSEPAVCSVSRSPGYAQFLYVF